MVTVFNGGGMNLRITRGGASRQALVLVVVAACAFWPGKSALADDEEPATPATVADLATARSQIYEGYVTLIEGLQDGDGIDAWAKDYLEAAFSFAQGTMETVMFVGTLSVPTFGFEWVLLISDVAQQAGTMSQMYSDMSTLMNNWSHGFIVGDRRAGCAAPVPGRATRSARNSPGPTVRERGSAQRVRQS